MRTLEALRILSDLTASQWGMVTTAQAARVCVTRLQLSRLTEQGHLERIGHGLYRDTGTPPDRFDSVKAAWLSINPSLTAQERLARMPADAVASGATAAYLLGLGGLVPEPYQFTVCTRRQTQRPEIAFRFRQLQSQSVTLREGIPVTTPEQTVADLLDEGMDKSLVADVFADIETSDSDSLVGLLLDAMLERGPTVASSMSVADLAGLPDDRLDSVIYDRLGAKMDDWDNPRDVVDKWSEPERVCFVVDVTVGEVMNGGFNQFFFNSAGREFFDIAAQCLTAVGAGQWAGIVQKACEIIVGDEGDKIVARWGDTLESFEASYKDNPLNELDDQFYALDEMTLISLMVAYMRANLACFADE